MGGGADAAAGQVFLEATVRVFNRTAVAQSLLYFANPAVHTNPDYQIIFPPRTQFVTQHAKQEFARWPIADTFYGFTDFSQGVNVSRWKNHPNAISMFAWNYEGDFLAGYDHGRQAGTLHLADPHVVPGKKFFTWGTGPTGRMWDHILTDEDGPYLELMVGAYSDNQPDYSWIQPYEVKLFKQFWYPFRQIGGVKNANLEAAVNLEVSGSTATVGFHATAPHSGAEALLAAGEKVLLRERIAIGPDKPFQRQVPLPAGAKEDDLRASLSAGGQELIAYSPVKIGRKPLPEPVKPPGPPREIKTNEELYLAGLRLEQFHSPALEPDPYYEEAIRRDPGDARANTALGILYLKRARFAEAEERLQAAIQRLSRNYTSPKDGEPYYYLGVALKSQGQADSAYDAFYKAAWSHAWEAAASYALAEIACLRRDHAAALGFLDRSLQLNALNTRALNLKAAVLRKMGRRAEFAKVAAQVAALDPLDMRLLAERHLASGDGPSSPSGIPRRAGMPLATLLRSQLEAYPEAGLETAVEYANAGLFDDAIQVLTQMVAVSARAARLPQFSSALPGGSGVSPMVYYYLGYFSEKQGQSGKAAEYYRRAAQAEPGYCFPFQLEAIDALHAAMKADPRDARAPYYLGNLLYDLQPENAAREWERARQLDPSFAMVHRNLAITYAHQQNALDKAITSLETAVRLSPNDAMALYELDQLYEAAAVALDKRLGMFDRHSAAVRERDDTLSRHIGLMVQAGRYNAAVDLLKSHHFHSWEGGARVNAQDPWIDAHLLRGQARAAANDHVGSLADFQAALDTRRIWKGRRFSVAGAHRRFSTGWEPPLMHWAGATRRARRGNSRPHNRPEAKAARVPPPIAAVRFCTTRHGRWRSSARVARQPPSSGSLSTWQAKRSCRAKRSITSPSSANGSRAARGWRRRTTSPALAILA